MSFNRAQSVSLRRRNISKTIATRGSAKISDFHEILLAEIKKQTLNNDRVVELSKFRLSTLLPSFDFSGEKRDLGLIINSLKKFPLFKFFINFGGIEEDALEILANNLQYILIRRNEYVIRQGDHCSTFYIVLRGKISIYKNCPKFEGAKNLEKEAKAVPSEEKLFSYGPGYCFGHTDLALRHQYTFSVKTDEDTELLTCTRKNFKLSLYKSIYRKEMDLRAYLRKILFSNSEIGFVNFEALYAETSLVHFVERTSDNLTLFQEGDENSNVYVILKSSFILTKGGLDIIEMVKDGVFGIECLFGEEKAFYTVKAMNNEALIFSINTKRLNPKIFKKLRDNLKESYEKFKKIVNDRFDNKEKIKIYEKMKYGIGGNVPIDFNWRVNQELKKKLKLMKSSKDSEGKLNLKQMKNTKKTMCLLKRPISNDKEDIRKNLTMRSMNYVGEGSKIIPDISVSPMLTGPRPKRSCRSSYLKNIAQTTSENDGSLQKTKYSMRLSTVTNTTITPTVSPAIEKKRTTRDSFRLRRPVPGEKVYVLKGVQDVLKGFNKKTGQKYLDSGSFKIPLASYILSSKGNKQK